MPARGHAPPGRCNHSLLRDAEYLPPPPPPPPQAGAGGRGWEGREWECVQGGVWGQGCGELLEELRALEEVGTGGLGLAAWE